MNPRAHGAGRQKGTPNKRTQELIDLAKENGFNPFEILMRFAMNDWVALGYKTPDVIKMTKDGGVVVEDRISAEMRLSAAEKACQYIYPKLKAIEHSGLEDAFEGAAKVTMDLVRASMAKDPALFPPTPIDAPEAAANEPEKRD